MINWNKWDPACIDDSEDLSEQSYVMSPNYNYEKLEEKMNDKDKEAYEKYLVENNVNQRQIWNELSLDEIWQAACEYKQKEIYELEKEKDYLCQKMENMRSIYKDSEKLQAENAKLREALDKIDRSNDDMKYFNSDIHVIIHEVRQVLKELEEK